MDHAAELVATVRLQAAGMRALDSPFYEALCDHLAADVGADGPVARVLAPYADAPFEAAYVLRLLGGVHRVVLSGAAPRLARHYPSTQGDGDADAAWAALGDLLADPPPMVLDAMTRPPQTNEVGRSVALMSGLLVVADRVRRPLSLREVGSSGGLNLRVDRYRYEQAGHQAGDPQSRVRFVDVWSGGTPPFDAPLEVADRRGCDQDPIDATTDDGSLTLLSYVWPEPAERFERIHAALEQAARFPVVIDRADAAGWVGEQLAARPAGTALVVFHSVVWQYLPTATQTAIRDQLHRAGAATTADAPLAWLRLEPRPATYVPAELRLTLWDGSVAAPVDELLATSGFHGGTLTWDPESPG